MLSGAIVGYATLHSRVDILVKAVQNGGLPLQHSRYAEVQMLSEFLNEVFPGVTDTPTADVCWVAKAIKARRPELAILSEALEVVDRYGEIKPLLTKLKREHPLDRNHDPQHDARVRDCLTEACAFAWVVLRELGTPAFSDTDGTPDLRLGNGRWVEVKAIHVSQEEDERMKRMLAGEIDSDQVTPPAPGLYGKFEKALKDAIKKFERQSHQETSATNIVFFNFTSLDTPQMLITDCVLAGLGTWADGMELRLKDDEECGDIQLVMSYSYDWKAPFRDPFNS